MREGWEIKPMGDVGTFQRGGGFLKSDFVENGFPCIHYGQIHMKLGPTTYSHLTSIPKSVAAKSKIASSGDVIIAITSEDVEGSCKSTAWMGGYDVAIGAHAAIYKHNLNPQFVSYYIQSCYFQKEKEQYTHGFKVVEIKPCDIAKIPIRFPSLPEQLRIVNILDREFAKIAALKANAEKSLQAAKDLFRHISNTYFTASYPISRFGDECDFVRGPFGGSLKKSCFKASGYPVYEQQHAIYSNFSFRYFVDEEKYNEMKRFTTHPGDLIMSCSGTIGKVAIIPEDAPTGIINQALLKLTTKKRILPDYLKWYMQSLSFETGIRKHSKGAAIQNVASVSVLKELSIPVPSLTQQEDIIAVLDELNDKSNALQENYQKTLTLCDDLMQALLRKAFNGEL